MKIELKSKRLILKPLIKIKRSRSTCIFSMRSEDIGYCRVALINWA